MKITLEMHDTIMIWEGPWDSCFQLLYRAFIGLCSTGGFGDKTELYQCIMDDIVENDLLKQDIFESDE